MAKLKAVLTEPTIRQQLRPAALKQQSNSKEETQHWVISMSEDPPWDLDQNLGGTGRFNCGGCEQAGRKQPNTKNRPTN